MPEDFDLNIFEIAVGDFDLNLIPDAARTPGSERFEAAVKEFYTNQLRKIADSYNVGIEGGKIRVTWRKDSLRPDALNVAVSALEKGDYATGVQILEFLLPSRGQDTMIHYNLGMAYSQTGRLDQAVKHLKRAVELAKDHVNAKVALGVAYTRQEKWDVAASVLKDAVLDDPDNPWALRNLGAALVKLNRELDSAVQYLSRSAELLPDDQQSWFGLAQAQILVGDNDGGDESLIRTIELQPYSQIAEIAKHLRSQIAQKTFRTNAVGDLRMDAVMYCLSALKFFSAMEPGEVRNVGFEIATLGMNGINVNDPKRAYHLRKMPGKSFSGLQLVCYEYVAFKQFAPELDIGFDVSKEYEEAKRMMGIGL